MTSHNNNGVKAALYIMSACIVILFTMLAYGIHQNQQTANRSREAICSLRGAYVNEVKATQRFIVQHPNGVAGLFSRQQLNDDLAQAKAQVKALRDASCS